MPEAPHPHTLTHAKLRRAQGDLPGARAILERLAGGRGERAELARAELTRLDGGASVATDPRIERLQAWLRRIHDSA